MNSSSTIKSNMSFYLAQGQILRNDVERQDYKLENRIRTLERYAKTNLPNQLTDFPDGLGRSGFMKLITTSDLQVAGIHAIHQADEVTTHWKEGDIYDPSSGSGKNLPILNKAVRCVEDGILLGCMSSSEKNILPTIVRGQLEGVQPFEVKTGKSSFEYKGCVRTAEEREKFKAAYPSISDINDFALKVSGREDVVGDFDESTGLSPGANWYEFGTRFMDDIATISYNEWMKSNKKIDLKDEVKDWALKYTEAIRIAYPVMIDQIGKLDNMCEDICRKEVELTVISAVGERSGIEGKSFRMRTGHAGFNLPKKRVIHLDSINKPRAKAEIEALPEDYRMKNVRGIVISQSLMTDSKETAEWLESLKIPTYFFTHNINSEIAKRNKERIVEMPDPLYYPLRENPDYGIYPLIGLMTLDSAGAAILRNCKRTVSQVHAVD